MRIMLLTAGTRGDVEPFSALVGSLGFPVYIVVSAAKWDFRKWNLPWVAGSPR